MYCLFIGVSKYGLGKAGKANQAKQSKEGKVKQAHMHSKEAILELGKPNPHYIVVSLTEISGHILTNLSMYWLVDEHVCLQVSLTSNRLDRHRQWKHHPCSLYNYMGIHTQAKLSLFAQWLNDG